jgi:hypothetical protein
MITLEEAVRRVNARIEPVIGDHIGDDVPRLLFAGTDMPSREVLDRLKVEMTIAYHQLKHEPAPAGCHPASPLTSSFMRVLLLGFEFGREVDR